jgi:general secretion pathway protein I
MTSRASNCYAGDSGFTLIEVLVALSIVVVSFVALYSGLLQMVSAMTLMQEKTIATWIAYDRITELRIINDYPEIGESDGEVEMGRINWLYTREIRATGSDDIRQVIVRVAPASDPENYLGIASGALIRKASGSTVGQIPGGNPGGSLEENAGNPEGIEE